jgi:predicted DNA-binding protein with PD1-like motif
VSDAAGCVFGGHVCAGCEVRTTAELLIASLPVGSLSREFDAATGYAELKSR